MSSWRRLGREVIPRRRGVRAAGIGAALLFGLVVAQVAPLLPVAAEEANPYVYAIEDVLIEGVEVKALVSRELLSSLQVSVGSFAPTLSDTRLALLEVYATPQAARIKQGSPRPDDGSYEESLSGSKDRLAEALTEVESQGRPVESAQDNLRSAQEAVDAARGTEASDSTADALRHAANALGTAEAIAANALDDLIGATRSDIPAATSHIEAAQAAPSEDHEYSEAIDAALGLVEASAARQAQLVDSLNAVATKNDRASRLLYEVASDEAVGATQRDLVVSAQEAIAAAQAELPQVQDLAASASSLLYHARSDLRHARSAGSPDTVAVLNDAYRNQIAEAQQVGVASSTSGVTVQDLATRLAAAAQAALADLDTIDAIDLGVEDDSLLILESNLQALLSSAIRISVGVDAAAFEFGQAADALSRLATDEVRVQETVLDASMSSFDHLYQALLDGDRLHLDSISMTLEHAVDLSLGLAGSVGNNAHASVLAVDQAQTQQEGVAWEMAEETPAEETTGTAATNGDDCRDETKHYDGFTVYIHYGDAGDDSCTGNDANDVFWMRGGDDYARALRGADQLHMGGGEDEGRADEGADEIWGGAHADQLFGSDGDDVIHDSEEESLDADYLSGGPDSDKCHMKDGDTDDRFFGGDGKDPEPSYDTICKIGRGCLYDYFESAGGYAIFPPPPPST